MTDTDWAWNGFCADFYWSTIFKTFYVSRLDLKGIIMPDQLTVPEFMDITNEDYKAPTTSVFCTRMAHCRNTVGALEEVKHIYNVNNTV